MRVLLFTTAQLVLGSGSGIRAGLIAEGLSKHGAQVGIVSAGVPNHFVSMGIVSYLYRPELDWSDLLAEAIRDFKPNILYGITEGMADIVGCAARKNGLPFVYDLHGIGVVEILELGCGHGPYLERLRDSFRWLSWVPQANAITVANPTLVGLARRVNRHVCPIIGMTDVEHFSPHGQVAVVEDGGARFRVLYAGNYYRWQGIDLLFATMTQLAVQQLPVSFTLVGSIGKSGLIPGWQERFPKRMLTTIEHLPYEQVPAYYRAASALVIPRPFMLSTYCAFPQKLVDYMASGTVVIATDLAPHRWALQQPPAGILCPASAIGLADGIRAAMDTGRATACAKEARRRAEQLFCHLRQTARIYALFADIISGNL